MHSYKGRTGGSILNRGRACRAGRARPAQREARARPRRGHAQPATALLLIERPPTPATADTVEVRDLAVYERLGSAKPEEAIA